MVLVPVNLSAWEIECCQPELVVGSTISGPLYLALGDEGPGQIDLRVEVAETPTGTEAAIGRTAGVQVGLVPPLAVGSHDVRGTLMFEWHGGPLILRWDGVGEDPEAAIVCAGRVQRIFLQPRILVRQDERSWGFGSWGDPIEVRSTTERPRHGIPPPDVETTVAHDFLLHVELGAPS